jgi:hypothetical protein
VPADPPNPAEREERLGEVLAALIESVEQGSAPDRAAWLARHPEFAAELDDFFASAAGWNRSALPTAIPSGPSRRTTVD